MGKGARFKKLRKESAIVRQLRGALFADRTPAGGVDESASAQERFVWRDREHPKHEHYSELVDTETGIVVMSMSATALPVDPPEDHWSRSRRRHNAGLSEKH